jgi:hypothetical protein
MFIYPKMSYRYEFHYERTINPNYWASFLGRNLTHEEMSVLDSVIKEKQLNNAIRSVHTFAASRGMYIYKMVSMSGNCFYESLQLLGLFENMTEFRHTIAVSMILFGDIKYFNPIDDRKLREIFEMTNEIEDVYCTKTKTFYKYNYDAMCVDLMTSTTWTRLPTELITMVISMILNVKFNVLHDNGHVTEIFINWPSNKGPPKEYWLGLIGELHYFPLVNCRGYDEENNVPHFDQMLRQFQNWARSMCLSMGRYTRYEIETETETENCDDISDTSNKELLIRQKVDTEKFKPVEQSVENSINFVEF